MLSVIKSLLLKLVDNIDAGNSELSEEECFKVIDVLKDMVDERDLMSKYQAYHYLGISRATFDNYVKDGKLPQGRKKQRFTSLFWYKKDLTKFKKENKK